MLSIVPEGRRHSISLNKIIKNLNKEFLEEKKAFDPEITVTIINTIQLN